MIEKDQKKIMLEKLIEPMWIYYCHIEGDTSTQHDALSIFYAYIRAWESVGLDVPNEQTIRVIMDEAAAVFEEAFFYKENDVREYVVQKYTERETESETGSDSN